MPTSDEARLVVRFESLGVESDRITDWTTRSDYLTSTDGFDFTIHDPELTRENRLEAQPVELTLDGAQQVLGRIDKTTIGNDGEAQKCMGRDYLADLVECRLDPSLAIKASHTLEDVIRLAACPVGINTVLAENELALRNVRSGKVTRGGGAPKDFKALTVDDLKPDSSQGVFEWLNRLVARHGATLQPSTRRSEILLEAPNYDQEPLYRLRRSTDAASGAANNIVEAWSDNDYSSVPTHTLFRSKAGAGAGGRKGIESDVTILSIAETVGGDLVDIMARIAVSGRRLPVVEKSPPLEAGQLYRLLYQQDKDSTSQDQVDRVARRAIGERMKETLVYHVTVRGHKDTESGAIWATNTIVDVQDAVAKVSEPLWISSVERTGEHTRLVCWRKGAFIL